MAHSIECVAECYILRRGDPSGHLCRRYTMSNDRIAKPSAMMVGEESELDLVHQRYLFVIGDVGGTNEGRWGHG